MFSLLGAHLLAPQIREIGFPLQVLLRPSPVLLVTNVRSQYYSTPNPGLGPKP